MNNVDVVKGLYEAFSRGDMPSVLGAMDPHIEWYEAEGNPYMPDGKPWVGPETILNVLFVRLGDEWEGFAVHPREFHDAGEIVVVQARYTGTYKATGKSMNAQVCHLWTVRNGNVTKFQQYVDTAQLQDVMGAVIGA